MTTFAATTDPPRAVADTFVGRRHLGLCGVVLIALFIGELPLLIAGCCAPRGATGLGTAWFVNDFAQYESAIRQGEHSASWLVYDAFTSEPHAPTLMFPMYVALGKLAALSHLPATWLERALEAIARAAVVLAVWHFARAFAANRWAARWALALTLFGSGFEIVGAALRGYSGNWAYESNGFGLLFAAPHVPLAMAATLTLAASVLVPGGSLSAWTMAVSAALGASIALLHPFHLPVLLLALLLAGAVFWRGGRGAGNLALAVAACIGALPVLIPTVATFNFDPFWLGTYSSQNQLPTPAPHELVVDLGPTLVLAVGGAWLLRARVAPFGLLAWLLLGAIAMYLPVPYQRRLGFGLQPALAVLAANTLVAWTAALATRRAAAVRLAVVAAAASGTLLILVSVVASALTDAPLALYRSNRDLDAAAAWLGTRVRPDEVIFADWNTSNYLAARTSGRVFGGHPVATLHAETKRAAMAIIFAHPDAVAAAGSFGARWVVYGPNEAALAAGSTSPVFQSGDVRVYRIGPE